MNTRKQSAQSIVRLVMAVAMLLFSACSQQTVQKSGEGAAMGAAVGAVGGMVTALIFGGNVAEATAHSAVYGASTGAAAGAISGAMTDSKAKKNTTGTMPADMKKLRETIGEDAFNGLQALVACKHDVAQAYGRTAAQSDNKNHALSGLWLQVIAFADNREEGEARAIFPALVAKDNRLTAPAQAETKMGESLQKLMDIREKNGMPRVCG